MILLLSGMDGCGMMVPSCLLGILDLIPGIVAAVAETDVGAEGEWDAEMMMMRKYSKNVEFFLAPTVSGIKRWCC